MSAPRFAIGAPVRVRAAYPPGHVRTPFYVRGAAGEVERICGRFANPEQGAYGRRDADRITLYRVRFSQRDLWPDYQGAPDDSVEVEIFEHWLEPTDGDNA